MNKHILVILSSFILYSCTTKESNSNLTNDSINATLENSINDSSSINYDSIKAIPQDTTTTYIFPPKDSLISERTPKVTLLPFSGKGYYYIRELAKNNPHIYRLPTINKIEYFPMFRYSYYTDCQEGDCIANFNKPAKCSDGQTIDTSVFNFKKYRFKLPDIHNLQTFIVCDTVEWNYGVPSKIKNGRQINRCYEVYFNKHCYLLLYDSLTREAKVIALHHPTTSTIDSPQARTFTIDKNFVIHLQDYAIDYGEDGLGQDFAPLNFTYDIRILPDGNLEVKKSNKKK
jgi:hypothetical protein